MTDWSSILDAELLAIRQRQAARLRAEHDRIARARQRIVDGRIVDRREALVEARRAHERVKGLVNS